MMQAQLPFVTSGVVRLELTLEQAEQLAPLVMHGAESKNTVFFAVTVPFSSETGTVWEFQVVEIPAKIGHKVLKLVRETKQ